MFALGRNGLAVGATLAIGVGLGISCSLLGLWTAINRENLTGVEPPHFVYRIVANDENRSPLGTEDLQNTLQAAFPDSRSAIVRYVRAELEDMNGSKRVEQVGLYTGDVIDLLGIKIERHLAAPASEERRALLTHRSGQALVSSNDARIALRVRSTHPALAANPIQFEVSAIPVVGFEGISLGSSPAFWVQHDAWKNWLLPASDPELLLDVAYPVDSAILELVEATPPENISARMVAAASVRGINITVQTIPGAARNPASLPLVQARSALIFVLAIALLLVSVGAGIALWLLVLLKQQTANRVRMLLGERRRVAAQRMIGVTAVITLVAAALGCAVLFFVLRLGASRPPFQELAMGNSLLSIAEWQHLAVAGATATVFVFMSLMLAAVTFIDRAHRQIVVVCIRPRAVKQLLAGSVGVVVLALALGIGSISGGRVLGQRDFGFRPEGLISVHIERDPEQWQSWVFDQRPVGPILDALGKRFHARSADSRLAASSQDPFGAYANKDFRLTTDKADRARMVSQVAITENFFTVIESGGGELLTGSETLYPRSGAVWVDKRFALDVLGGDLSLRSPPGILSSDFGRAGEVLKPIAIVPSVFRRQLHEAPTPTMFRSLALANELHWIWLRTDAQLDVRDVQVLVGTVLAEQGIDVKRVTAARVSDVVELGMRAEFTQQRLLLGFSTLLLVLALVGIVTMVAFAARVLSKQISIRMALGSSRVMALLESIGPTPVGLIVSCVLAVAVSIFWLRSASMLYGFGQFETFGFPVTAIVLAAVIGAFTVFALAQQIRDTNLCQALRDD